MAMKKMSFAKKGDNVMIVGNAQCTGGDDLAPHQDKYGLVRSKDRDGLCEVELNTGGFVRAWNINLKIIKQY